MLFLKSSQPVLMCRKGGFIADVIEKSTSTIEVLRTVKLILMMEQASLQVMLPCRKNQRIYHDRRYHGKP